MEEVVLLEETNTELFIILMYMINYFSLLYEVKNHKDEREDEEYILSVIKQVIVLICYCIY